MGILFCDGRGNHIVFDEKKLSGETELLARRLGMSLEEFQKTLQSSDESVCDRLGMSVEEFRRITMGERS